MALFTNWWKRRRNALPAGAVPGERGGANLRKRAKAAVVAATPGGSMFKKRSDELKRALAGEF